MILFTNSIIVHKMSPSQPLPGFLGIPWWKNSAPLLPFDIFGWINIMWNFLCFTANILTWLWIYIIDWVGEPHRCVKQALSSGILANVFQKISVVGGHCRNHLFNVNYSTQLQIDERSLWFTFEFNKINLHVEFWPSGKVFELTFPFLSLEKKVKTLYEIDIPRPFLKLAL